MKEKNILQEKHPVAYWAMYAIVLGLLALRLNTVTIIVFLLMTVLLSISMPIIALTAFQCSLIANSYLGNYYYLNFLICAIIFAIWCLRIKETRYIPKREAPFIVAMIYCILISMINGYGSLRVMVAFILIVLLSRSFLNASIINNSDIICSLTYTAIFSGVIGLISNSYGLSYGAGSVNRFLSSYGDPNFYCMVAVSAIIGLVFYNEKHKICIIPIIILAVFCFLTSSKSLLLLIGANALVFLLRSSISAKKKIAAIVITVVVLIIVNWILQNWYDQNIFLNYLYRFTQESAGNSEMDSLTTGRSVVQTKFLNYFFNNQSILKIFFGNGYIGTTKIAPSLGLKVDTTHMVYLQILMDFGVIGAGLFLYIFIKGFITAGTYQKQILMTYFIAMFFLSWQFTVPYFGFYLMLYNDKPFLEVEDNAQ